MAWAPAWYPLFPSAPAAGDAGPADGTTGGCGVRSDASTDSEMVGSGFLDTMPLPVPEALRLPKTSRQLACNMWSFIARVREAYPDAAPVDLFKNLADELIPMEGEGHRTRLEGVETLSWGGALFTIRQRRVLNNWPTRRYTRAVRYFRSTEALQGLLARLSDYLPQYCSLINFLWQHLSGCHVPVALSDVVRTGCWQLFQAVTRTATFAVEIAGLELGAHPPPEFERDRTWLEDGQAALATILITAFRMAPEAMPAYTDEEVTGFMTTLEAPGGDGGEPPVVPPPPPGLLPDLD